MKWAWIWILTGTALLKMTLAVADSNQVQQKLTEVQTRVEMARLAMPVLRVMHSNAEHSI